MEHFVAKSADVEIATLLHLKVEVIYAKPVEHHGAVVYGPAVGPKKAVPCTCLALDDEDHVVDHAVTVVIEVKGVRNHTIDKVDGSLQQGKLAFGTVSVVIADGVGRCVVRLVVLLRVDVLIGEESLAVRLGIEEGTQVELVVTDMMVVVVQRNGLIIGGIEH